MSSTSAGRPPTRRLKSEDFPTLGRPTSETTGRFRSSGVTCWAGATRRPTSVVLPFVAEPGDRLGRVGPVGRHLRVQAQVSGPAEELGDLHAGGLADVANHLPALPYHDPLLALALDQDGGVDDHVPLRALLPVIDGDGGGVRELVAQAHEELLADQLAGQEPLAAIGDGLLVI